MGSGSRVGPGVSGCRVQGANSRLSKCHSEQGIRSPLGEQGHGLNQLLLQLMDSRGLRLWTRETVELGVSVLEGPVVFHCRKRPRHGRGEEIEAEGV